jgi:Putative prokaryotic signal transducing protein
MRAGAIGASGGGMKTVCEVANVIEGHLLLGLMRQQGLQAQLLGEHLQGAIGLLPVSGLLRLVVDDADLERAQALVRDWESAPPQVDDMPWAQG